MYEIKNTTVLRAVQQYSRTFRMKLVFENERTIYGDHIGETVIEHIMSEDDGIPIGQVISKRVEITLYSDVPIRKGDGFSLYIYLMNLSGNPLSPLYGMTHEELSEFTNEEISSLSTDRIALRGEYISMGEFIVAKVTRNGREVKVIAYDRLYSDKPFKRRINGSVGSSQLIDIILKEMGITRRIVPEAGAIISSDDEIVYDCNGEIIIAADEYEFEISEIPKGATCRELLGYIAAISGRNGILDRSGAYTTIFISNERDAIDVNKIDSPSLAESNVKIAGIRCNSGETVLEVGNPDDSYGVEIDCPFMTSERLSEIWQELSQFTWRPAEIYERVADPRRELGDIILIGDYIIPITSLIYHFDGGLAADLSACGQIEN